MKILDKAFFAILIILFVFSFFSVIATLVTLWNDYSVSVSSEGFKNIISEFENYSNVFGATLAIFIAYLAIHNIKIATDASNAAIEASKAALDSNIERRFEERYADWKLTMDHSFVEIEQKDPLMKREFVRIRRKFFVDLYKRDFNVSNKKDLEELFGNHFKTLCDFFENQNSNFISKGVYPNLNYSYSYDSFRFLFIRSIDGQYDNIEKDLEEMYINSLSKRYVVSN